MDWRPSDNQGCSRLAAAHRQPAAPASTAPTRVRGGGGAPLLLTGMVLLLIGTGGTPGAMAAAPSDTLVSADTMSERISISRKVLPDVAATVVPRDEAPGRPPRLDDPVAAAYAFREARAAAAGGDFALARSHMDQALAADPEQVQFGWWLSGEVLKRFDPGAILWVLPRTLRTAAADPLDRLRLFVQLHQALLLFAAVFWSILVVQYLATYWRYLAHDLTSMFYRDPRHRLRSWLPLLLVTAVLLVRPGWIGLLALISVPLVIQARGRNRWTLVATWVLTAFLVFPHWPLLRQAAPVLDPASETTLLARASQLPVSTQLMRSLETRLAQAEDRDRRARLQLALAIQHARGGRYDRSNELLHEVLQHQPQNVPAQVNLANNTYYLGRLDAAVQGYQAARDLAPGRGQIPYNLAQVYFKKLFVPEASEALEAARGLGFHPPPWEDVTGDANGYSPVVYLGPDSAALMASCRREAGNYPPLVSIASWSDFLGCPPLSLFLLLVGALTTALGLVRWWSNQEDPRGCDNCGSIVCRTCCEIRSGTWYCQPCAETAGRARSEMVLATLLKNRSRTVGLARSARLSLLARLIPGAGHLALGATRRAAVRAFVLACGIHAILFAWTFDPALAWATPGLALAEETLHPLWFPLPASSWQGWNFWPVIAGVVLVGASYLTALLDGTNLRRRVPEHFLRAAGEQERPAGTLARHGA
ncbi:MAG: hypothetical protein R6X25_12010 [Candidatus Krumholzibacteriia bacterium]